MMTHGEDYRLLRNLNLLSDSPQELNREDSFHYIRGDIVEKMRCAYDKNAVL